MKKNKKVIKQGFVRITAVILLVAMVFLAIGAFIYTDNTKVSATEINETEVQMRESYHNIIDEEVELNLCADTQSEAYNNANEFMEEAEHYAGKIVRIEGYCSIYEENGQTYYSCVVPSEDDKPSWAGVEFEMEDFRSYPEHNDFIKVQGVADCYVEGEYQYPILRDAIIIDW